MYSAIPADGVYAAWFTVLGHGPITGSVVPGERYQAAVSVGTNPTFSGRTRTVEAFVLDSEADLYGQHVAVDFVARLRGQHKFDSVDDLVAAMGRDTGEGPPDPGVRLAPGCHQAVDLVDRRRGALDHAHVQHRLQRLGGLVGADVGRRVPPSCSANVKTLRAFGISGLGLKSMSAKPSSNSKLRGSSTAVISQYPACLSPSGPVMKYVIRPPGLRSWSTTVAG